MKPVNYSRLSIRQRLPILICLLLLTMILVFGLISYWGVRKAALRVGEDRLKSLTEQLGTLLSGTSHSSISSAYASSNKLAIKSYLLSNGQDSSAETIRILEGLRKDTSYVQVELVNKLRVRVLKSAREGVNINISEDSVLSQLKSDAKPDSGSVGKLYAIDSFVYYPIIGTVVDNNKVLGFVIKWRKMTTTSKSLEQLSQLLGTDAKLLMGNEDGSVWTDMRLAVSSPHLSQKINRITEYRDVKQNKVLAYVRSIPNTHWLVAIELSKKKVLQTVNHFFYWLMLAGAVLLAIGIFAARVMSRKISAPLGQLTRAATELAAGNYSSIVPVHRYDELGKLARAFNAMSMQVQKAQKALEKKAEKYKLLFEKNPMPMWIILKSNLEIIDVNEAAINHYGYSRTEFLKLKSTDLRPQEDVEKYLASIKQESVGINRRGIWRHKTKGGNVIMVDVIADDLLYNDQPARLILANDVTEKLNAEAELVRNRVMQQQLITETTIQAQEKEREEIGKELHDNINQILACTKLYLEIAKSGNNGMMPEVISKSYENVNLAIGEIRQLSKRLVSPALDTNLVEAIGDLTAELKAITPIKIIFTYEDLNEEWLDDNIKLMLYRIVQEQINNILKYAAASNILINLKTDHRFLYLVIADNGIGFDTSKKSKGIGLRNIESRAKFYNGIVNIISRQGEGTRLEVSLPLENRPRLAI